MYGLVLWREMAVFNGVFFNYYVKFLQQLLE